MNNTNVLFDTFNARNLSFEQVALTFVSNKQFDELIDNNHTLLMGPRGSGKTTLLKMLTPMALNVWTGKKANLVKVRMPFIGVYIPTDTQFKRQLDYLKSTLEYTDFELVSRALICVNVLIAFIRSFSYTCNKEDIEKEIEFSSKLILAWQLPRPMAPTLHSIEEALLIRVKEINNYVNKLVYALKKGLSNIHPPDYFFDEFLSLCDYACTAYDIVYTNESTTKWALCFDELELAPEWLQHELLGYLRSTNQRFIYKLTTSPVVTINKFLNENSGNIDATHLNDYRVVKTWPSDNNDLIRWSKFCDILTSNKLNRKYGKQVNPKELFGNDNLSRSMFSTVYENIKDTEEYAKNGFVWNIIKDYAEIDDSLRLFLIRKNINPIDPVPHSKSQKDTVFRKLKEILIYRYNFHSNSKIRTRKNPALYYGVPYIYEICDGNPRQLIGLLDEMLNKTTISNDKIVPLKVTEQSEVVSATSAHYLKLLSSHPEGLISVKKQYDIVEVLSRIGFYFHEKLIHEPFTIDPVGSFIIDEHVDQYIVELLKFALAHGAIIYVNSSEAISMKGLIGKRFRLSYLLTPYFRLPKRNYTAVNLSTILNYKFNSSSQLNISFA